MSNIKNMVGKRYGRLNVIRLFEMRPRKGGSLAYWLCQCDCGNQKSIAGSSLRNGMTQSCGCLQIERLQEAIITHGHTLGGRQTKEYIAYRALLDRCYNPKNKDYYNYGKRGIAVCERWLGNGGFENFMKDMGYAPSNKHTIDRKDNNENYNVKNCRWATRAEQARNKRNAARDGNTAVTDLAMLHGFKYHTLMDRFRSGDRGTALIRPLKTLSINWKVERR